MGKYGTFSRTILEDSPVAYYRCDDASGTTLTDASGNARNGTITATGVSYNGTAGFNQSYEDNTQMSVDGLTGDLLTSTNAALVFAANADYTIEFAFFMAGTLGVLCRDDTGSAGHIAFFASGGFIACRSGGTTATSAIGSTAYNDFAWHYCQFVRRGGATPNQELWIDGVKIIDTTAGTGAATTRWHLGRNGNLTTYTSAFVDEWSFYGSALSTTRLDAHYRAWKTIPAPSPLLTGMG